MFNGAAKYGPKPDRVLESRGGHSNAYTSNDVTAYYEDFAPDALSRRSSTSSRTDALLRLTTDSLEQEREVVKEERRLRTENSIFGLMEEQLEALVFSRTFVPLAGDRLDGRHRADHARRLRRVLPHVLRAEQRRGLRGGRHGSGRDARAVIERHYADIAAGSRPAPVAQGEPSQRGERRAGVRYPAQAPAPRRVARPRCAQLRLGGARRPPGAPRRRRIVPAPAAPRAGRGGRRFGVDYGAGASTRGCSSRSRSSRRVKTARAEAMLWEEIDKVATKGVSGAEVRRARCCAAPSCTSSRHQDRARPRPGRGTSATSARPGARSSTTPRWARATCGARRRRVPGSREALRRRARPEVKR